MHHIPVSLCCPVGRRLLLMAVVGTRQHLSDVTSGFRTLAASFSASLCKHTSVLVKGAVRAKSCFGNRPNRTEDRRGAGGDQLPRTSPTCQSRETRSSLPLRGSFLKSSFFCCGNIYCSSVLSRSALCPTAFQPNI